MLDIRGNAKGKTNFRDSVKNKLSNCWTEWALHIQCFSFCLIVFEAFSSASYAYLKILFFIILFHLSLLYVFCCCLHIYRNTAKTLDLDYNMGRAFVYYQNILFCGTSMGSSRLNDNKSKFPRAAQWGTSLLNWKPGTAKCYGVVRARSMRAFDPHFRTTTERSTARETMKVWEELMLRQPGRPTTLSQKKSEKFAHQNLNM